MSRAKLSVLIPAGNAERRIVACTESARFADEVVLVLDAASVDNTEELAAPLVDRTITHVYENSAAQKNWAIPQMAHEWVLVVDADERVTDELRDEILSILENDGTPHGAYRIWRRNHFMGRPLKRCWKSDSVIRLFKRDSSKYQDRQVHADIECDGSVGKLRGKLLHYTFEDFARYMKTFDKFTTWGAIDKATKMRSVSWVHLTIRPAWQFFRRYVLDLGFLDGKAGLIVCGLGAFKVFLKYAKVWEMVEGRDSTSEAPDDV